MISVEEAKQLLTEKVQKSEPVELSITDAFNCVLAEDIFSPIDLPSFDQSSMDGYAIAARSLTSQKGFEVIGEVKAGDKGDLKLHPGQAVRIFTGAALPCSADTIVIQEKVRRDNGSIYLSEDFQKRKFIRLKGSQVKKGEIALKKGSVLNPAAIGFIASLGINKLKVYRKPIVSVLATGDEIIHPGNELQSGQIFESNSFSLHAALKQMHIEPQNILHSRDEKNILRAQVEKCLNDSDITIVTGGISVGDYDFVFEVMQELSVEVVFYKVAQRPGKPIFAGKKGNKWVFALPGNPASALVCFYEYVFPAIRMMMGFGNPFLLAIQLPLLKGISNPDHRAQFIRAKRQAEGIMPLEGQDSNMLRSFAQSDALIYVPKEKQQVNKGESVEVYLLPFEN